MSTEQVSVATPANLIIFQDTNIGLALDTIKSSPIKIYYLEVTNPNVSPVYLKLFLTTAPGSVVVGSTDPDLVIYIPANSVLPVNFMQDAATVGLTENQASAICVTTGGTTSFASPALPVTAVIQYV